MPSSDRPADTEGMNAPVTRHQATGAYRRWTPPSFDDPAADEEAAAVEAEAARQEPPSPPKPAVEPKPPAAPAAKPAEPEVPAIKLPTADEIEAMYEQARADGEKAGYDEGRERANAQARAEVAKITALLQSMDESLDRLGGEVAEEIIELAIALARQMVGKTLSERPEAILPIVNEALQQMPQGKVRIHLNPEDVQLVRQHMEDQLDHSHHQLIEDATIERGGCHLEAAGGNIDATMATRWERVLASLGRTPPPEPEPPSDA